MDMWFPLLVLSSGGEGVKTHDQGLSRVPPTLVVAMFIHVNCAITYMPHTYDTRARIHGYATNTHPRFGKGPVKREPSPLELETLLARNRP